MNRRFPIRLLIVAFLSSGVFVWLSHGQSLGFRSEHDGRGYRVAVALDGEDTLIPPAEGLWSIATDWKKGRPAEWVHGVPTEMKHAGDWTILRGKHRLAQTRRHEEGDIAGFKKYPDWDAFVFGWCGQLIDPYGSQGGQPHHTNYAQVRRFIRRIKTKGSSAVRGNDVEDWTAFWITAPFLNAAAQFKELGLTLTD